MSRRRLRVVCSSDEEEEPPRPPPLPQQGDMDDVIIDDIETDLQTVTINSSNPTPDTNNSTTNSTNINSRFSSEPIPLDISDDEEHIIINNSTNHSNYSSTSDNNQSDNSNYFRVSDSPVNGVLERLGLRLKSEWLDSCLRALQSSVRGFQGMDNSTMAKLCFEQFLCSDMNYCGAGVLPPNVHTLHLVDFKGPFVLQVDEIVNISCPLRGRYQNAAPGSKRCSKLSMTDGVQRVFGMEYRPIKDLEVLAPAGLKIVVLNVNIRHGLLMLVPEVLEVLGGTVKELDAARQRLVNEIHKPPRGKRNRSGLVPPLATRATLAAWPTHNATVPGHVDRTVGENTTPLPGREQETASGIPATDRHRQADAGPGSGTVVEPRTSSAPQPQECVNVLRHNDVPTITPSQASRQGTTFYTPTNGRPRQDFAVPVSRNNAEPNSLPGVQPQESVTVPRNIDRSASTPLEAVGQGIAFGTPVNNMPIEDVVSMSMNIAKLNTSSASQPRECVTVPQHIYGSTAEVVTPVQAAGQDIHADYMPREDVTVPVGGDESEPNTSSAVAMDIEEISLANDLVHPFIFSRDKEIPFTYLASLSAKWAAIEDNASIVKGKIKCFLTGVKGFQYKKRTVYELRVYVDDGSLISEILIDHSVVQSGIDFSPQEVTCALASSDTKLVSEMKETLKQFQIFLINFEGTMLVEMSRTSPVPVAVELNQGCQASDARLLLKRLKSSNSAPPRKHTFESYQHIPLKIIKAYEAPCAKEAKIIDDDIEKGMVDQDNLIKG